MLSECTREVIVKRGISIPDNDLQSTVSFRNSFVLGLKEVDDPGSIGKGLHPDESG